MRRTLNGLGSGLGARLMCALLAGAPMAARAQEPAPDGPVDGASALDQLLENVRYWQARGRPDKAAEAWRKVLKSDPGHAEALAELCLFAARAGRADEAKSLLERLRKAHPGHPRIAGLEQALGLGARYDDLLAQARAAVKSGHITEGLELYRKLFGGQTPTGSVALEYYQTLGGTAGGWEAARAGLERLMNDNPKDGRYALAYARHLTYVEATRRDGLDRLEKLAGAGQADADRALRQALLWLVMTPADLPRFDRFLASHPADEAVKARVAEVRAGVLARNAAEAERERLKSGYDALDRSDADLAEVIFRRAVKANPRDLNALAGLGNTLLEKQAFDEAKQIFERVKAAAPKRKELWEKSLRAASFWSLVHKAEADRAAGKLDEARVGLEEAAKLSPEDAPHAELVLANVLVDQRAYAEAQAILEELVAHDPKHVAAMKALVELYLRAGDLEKALAMNAALAQNDEASAYRETWLRAEVLRREAVEKRQAGALVEAEALLDAARATDPTSRNVLLEQTYTWLDVGKVADARKAIGELERLSKEAPDKKDGAGKTGPEGAPDRDVLVANAWVLAAEQRFEEGLDLLEHIKDADLDPGTVKLKRRLRVQADIAQALKLAGRGKLISAQARLTELQRSHREDPELTGLVANAWADMGKYDQALAVMYDALASVKTETPTLKLQLAGILHKADRDAELLSVLRELDGEADLTGPERKGLADLKIAYAVKRADVAREGGYLARAFNLLQGPLREYPQDTRLMTALGRLFLSAGEFSEANELFERVLTMKPTDLEARQGAVQSAIELGREGTARKLVEDGLGMADDDPRMHLVAGRMHVLLGEDGEAIDAFERALALEEGRTAPEGDGSWHFDALLAGAEKTFGKRTSEPRDDLALRQEIVAEIDRVRARHAIRVGTSFGIRARPGTSGTSQLLALDLPTWMSIPTGYQGRLTFGVTPVLVDAGALSLDEELTASRFGTTGVDLFGQAAGSFGQGLTGVELKLTEEIGVWRFDVGATPLGFRVQTLTGGFSWNDRFGAVGLHLEGHRRAVTESLLSWGGAEDIATGAVWGGVTKNGGRLDLGISSDDVTWYLLGWGDWLVGQRVAENWAFGGGTGLSWRLYDWDGVAFSTGLDVSSAFYDKNLRHFTLGHGGYFSPQAFVSGAFPLRLDKSEGDLTYQAGASLGLVWFREDAAAYFPTDAARQDLRGGLLDDDDEPVEAYHDGQESLAFAFNLDGQLAYEVAAGLRLGVTVGVHTGHDFKEYSGGVFLGYTFQQKVAGPGERSTPFGDE